MEPTEDQKLYIAELLDCDFRSRTEEEKTAIIGGIECFRKINKIHSVRFRSFLMEVQSVLENRPLIEALLAQPQNENFELVRGFTFNWDLLEAVHRTLMIVLTKLNEFESSKCSMAEYITCYLELIMFTLKTRIVTNQRLLSF
jgi:hypothetical protein